MLAASQTVNMVNLNEECETEEGTSSTDLAETEEDDG